MSKTIVNMLFGYFAPSREEFITQGLRDTIMATLMYLMTGRSLLVTTYKSMGYGARWL